VYGQTELSPFLARTGPDDSIEAIGHPGVAAAAVLGVPDPDWGEQVAAVITPAGQAPTAAELHVRGLLAPYKTPRHWYVCDTVPANAMGKVRRFHLRRRIADGELPELEPGGYGASVRVEMSQRRAAAAGSSAYAATPRRTPGRCGWASAQSSK
jgi:hypothetical protein